MLVDQKPSYRQITQQDYQAMSGPNWPSLDEFLKGGKIEQFVADELDQMLGEVDTKRKKLSSFCVLPFYGKEFPSNEHCCLLPKNYNIDRIRDDMLNNRRTPDCDKCWMLEDAGYLSDRQVKNFTLDFYSDTDLLYLYERAMNGEYSTTHYKIDASNYCNATCVTCGSSASTAWGDLLKNNQEIVKDFYGKNRNPEPLYVLKKNSEEISIDYKTAKFVLLRGGESTMIRTHWDIVENIVNAGNDECCISFVTNGSFNLTDRQKALLKQLKNVNFCFSIDGIEKVYEYMRFPLSWEKTVDNVNWAQDEGYLVSASYTISNLNILYYEQTTKWFDDNSIHYLDNPVYSPEYFSPRSLGSDIKQKIIDRTNHSMVRHLLSTHTDVDETNYKEFFKRIQYQDSLKKIKLRDYLPDFAELIDY